MGEITLKKKQVLIVDDNMFDISILRQMLTPTGVEMEGALNYTETYALLEKNTYDLILMDHIMPKKDGIQMLKEIRRMHLCDDTPVIIVTANDMSASRHRYEDFGFAGYVEKPVDKEKLIRTMLDCLEQGNKN